MSAEEATLIAGAIGGVLGIVGGIVGAVVGVMVGLFGGERWLRRWGDVECRIEEGDWYVERGRGGGVVKERRLRVAFINRKELPVTLSDVRIEFSKKGGEPLEEWALPLVRLVKEPGSLADERITKFAAVTLHPHILVPLEFSVVPEGGACARHRAGAGRQDESVGGDRQRNVRSHPYWRTRQAGEARRTLARSRSRGLARWDPKTLRT